MEEVPVLQNRQAMRLTLLAQDIVSGSRLAQLSLGWNSKLSQQKGNSWSEHGEKSKRAGKPTEKKRSGAARYALRSSEARLRCLGR